MALEGLAGAPQLNIVQSRTNRMEKHVGSDYVDTYNDAQMAKYNNEYNYWLWQQQAEYNTPAAQMQRARDAGLNPNVVAGNVSSGNLSNIPESKGKLSGNIRSNELASMNLGLNAFNSVLQAMSDGVQAMSTLSGIPDDIPAYRQALTKMAQEGAFTAGEKSQIATAQRILSNIDVSKGFWEIGADPSTYLGGEFDVKEGSPFTTQRSLQNQALKVLNTLRGNQNELVIKNGELIEIKKDLTESQYDMNQLQQDLMKINTGNKVVDTVLKYGMPIIYRSIFKN